MLIFTFCLREKSTSLPNSSLSMFGFYVLGHDGDVHFVAIGFVLKNDTKVKCIVPISEGDSHPKEASFWIFQSDCISSGAIDGLDYGLFVIGWHFGLPEDLSLFVDEGYFDDSVLLGHFDAALPDHVFPVVEVVAFGRGQRRDLEDGDPFGLVAEDQLG